MASQRRPRNSAPWVQLEPDFEERWPGSSRSASSCVTNLWALNSRLQVRAEAWVRREGYPSVAAFNVLTVLHGAEQPLLPSEIAGRMLVSRPTISGILDTLERNGQVRRTSHGTDGRMRLVAITAGARKRVEASMHTLHLVERRLMAAVPAADQERLLRILGQMQSMVEVFGPDPNPPAAVASQALEGVAGG